MIPTTPPAKRFLSTPSVGRATHRRRGRDADHNPFLSTPSVGRATSWARSWQLLTRISIHALRGEGDQTAMKAYAQRSNFYPRPPWGGRPSCGRSGPAAIISIHALRGEGDQNGINMRPTSTISIHALRGEGDAGLIWHFVRRLRFLSTPSVGRATCRGGLVRRREEISIHALRGEGDDRIEWKAPDGYISIHALRGEGDPSLTERRYPHGNFYPRPPWGGRRFICPRHGKWI